jgi:hypothetical protein
VTPSLFFSTLENFSMKKTLIALAAVAVSSAVMAQATISGTFNVDVQNTIAATNTNTVGMGDAQVRFTTNEDLGGGMKMSASAVMDADAGRGGNVLGMGYSAALSGGFGAVSLTNGVVGNAETSAGISAASDMNHAVGGYFLRTRLQYALPEIVKGLGIQLRWDNDKNYDKDANAPKGATTPDGDDTDINFDYTIGNGYISYGANVNKLGDGSAVYLGYNFGVAKVDVALTNYDHSEVAVVVPMGAVTLGAQYMYGDYADAYGVRATYALSKRTSVSFNYVNIKDTTVKVNQAKAGDEPVAQKHGANYRVRVSHSF